MQMALTFWVEIVQEARREREMNEFQQKLANTSINAGIEKLRANFAPPTD